MLLPSARRYHRFWALSEKPCKACMYDSVIIDDEEVHAAVARPT
jgi:hypothetical protein